MAKRIPGFLSITLPQAMPIMERQLSKMGLMPGEALGAGSFGVVYSTRDMDGMVAPYVAKITLDYLEGWTTEWIMRLYKKKTNRLKLRGVPRFDGIWRTDKEYTYKGPIGLWQKRRRPAYVIIREDITPLDADMINNLPRGVVSEYVANGIDWIERIKHGDVIGATNLERKLLRDLSIMESTGSMSLIAESLRFLLKVPIILNDIHSANVGYRDDASRIEIPWSSTGGSFTGFMGPRLVVLDVGFSQILKRPRIKRGMAANPVNPFEPPPHLLEPVLDSIPIG